MTIIEQRGWLKTPTYKAVLISLPRYLNTHSHFASGDLIGHMIG